MCGVVRRFFDTFGFVLLVTKSTGLTVYLWDVGFVFVFMVMFVINDVGQFFTEESVEWLHGSIAEYVIIIFLTDKYVSLYYY